MNESKLNSETQVPVPQDDGADILQNTREDLPSGLSRRDFIKISAYGAASLLLSGSLGSWLTSIDDEPPPIETTLSPTKTLKPPSTETPEPSIQIEKFMQPELVHDVEVYGSSV